MAKGAAETAAAGENGADSVSQNAAADENVTSVSENDMEASQTEASQAEGWQLDEDRVKVKGIYITGAMAGTANMDNLIDLVDRTELNAMVIDVKNDEGRVVYEMDSPLVNEIGASRRLVTDMPALVEKCHEHGIYLIARIVAFKDPYLAEMRTELALHDQEGNLFRDKSGLAWVNPYKTEVWEYLMEIAQEAVEVGFDEIQFDYIRFATDKGMADVDFGPEAEGRNKEEIITEFTVYAAERLHELGVPVSADVYGIIIDSALDASLVGQNYYEMSRHLDYISPMVYPSHYGPGNLGLAVPDAQPYETIYRSMSASRRVLAGYVTQEETESVSGNAVSDAAGSGVGNAASGATGSSMENAEPDAAESGSGNAESDAAGSGSEDTASDGGSLAEDASGKSGSAAAVGNGPGMTAAEAISGAAERIAEKAADVSGNEMTENVIESEAEAEISYEDLPDPKTLTPAEEIRADVRPWLQDFTATWVQGHISYGPEEIRAQIQAVYDAGYEEWILWNAANRYTEGGLLPDEKEEDS